MTFSRRTLRPYAVCRRLRIAMLKARLAQLQCVAGGIRCATPDEALLRARLLAQAGVVGLELAALELRW